MQLCNCSTTQLNSSAAAPSQPHSFCPAMGVPYHTTAQVYNLNCSTTQLHNCATAQSANYTTAQMLNLSTLVYTLGCTGHQMFWSLCKIPCPALQYRVGHDPSDLLGRGLISLPPIDSPFWSPTFYVGPFWGPTFLLLFYQAPLSSKPFFLTFSGEN